MGLVYADIELINLADETLCEEGYLPKEKVRSIPINVMADSGAIRLTINESIRSKLGLKIRSSMDVLLADGSKINLPVAGPVRIKFKERDCITDAYVLPNNEEPLLGAVPLELMDLIIIPTAQKIDYNPLHPDGPLGSLK
ncbi:MAG: clan AA aspartic protease [Ferruginibacter sp.]|nr:clan AA aspartic protease [Ferruginibacter sp.]